MNSARRQVPTVGSDLQSSTGPSHASTYPQNCHRFSEICPGFAFVRILLIEDDRRTSEFIAKGFIEAGHICDVIADGRDALPHAVHETYDVLVIDRMLPGIDGLSLLRSVR